MMDPLAAQVARRFTAEQAKDAARTAASMGDPIELLHKFEAGLHYVGRLEADIPKMREAQRIYEAAGPDIEYLVAKGVVTDHHVVEAVTLWRKEIFSYAWAVKMSIQRMQEAGGNLLFLALLQQYVLPPTIRKKVEAAAKLMARTRMQTPEKPVAIDAYEKMMVGYRALVQTAKDAVAHGKPHGTGEAPAAEKVQAGPFTIVNTGGFSEEDVAKAAKVVVEAAHLLGTKGLGKVCYGQVLLSNTLSKSDILAFYVVQKDEMFVRANLKGKESAAVHTVVHELAHRLQFQFLASKKREINAIYARIKNKAQTAARERLEAVRNDPNLRPKPGDKFESKGVAYKVTGLDLNRTYEWVVKLELEEDPRIGAKIDLLSYASIKGILPKIPPGSGFVTTYAQKDPDENFAEMTAAWCLNQLPADQVEMLETVL